MHGLLAHAGPRIYNSCHARDSRQINSERADTFCYDMGIREPAHQAMDSVKDTAADAVDTVKDESASAANDVKDQAQDAKQNVQETAS